MRLVSLIETVIIDLLNGCVTTAAEQLGRKESELLQFLKVGIQFD
jgi:hypothetical protein